MQDGHGQRRAIERQDMAVKFGRHERKAAQHEIGDFVVQHRFGERAMQIETEVAGAVPPPFARIVEAVAPDLPKYGSPVANREMRTSAGGATSRVTSVALAKCSAGAVSKRAA